MATQQATSDQFHGLVESLAKSNSVQRLQDMLADAERKHLESAVNEDGRSALAGLHVQLVEAALQWKADKATPLHLVHDGTGNDRNGDREEPRKTISENHHRHLPRVNDGDDFHGGGDDPIDLATLPEPGPMRFVVEDFIPENYPTNVYADSGQGKSYLALHLACAITTGRPFLNREVVRGPVLFLDWELDQDLQRLRWGEVTRGQGCDKPPSGLHYKRMAAPLLDSLDYIYHWLDTVRPILTIVDSVGMALGDDPIDHRRIIRFYSELRSLGTVLCIDHQPKPGGDSGYAAKTEFGSSYKRHLARCSWQLERLVADSTKVNLVLRHKKSNFGPLCADVHATLTFEGDDLKVVKLDVATVPGGVPAVQPTVRTKIVEALKREPLSAEGLAAVIPEYGLGSIKNELTALRKDGVVVVVSKAGRTRAYGLKANLENHNRHKPLAGDDDDFQPRHDGACVICGAEPWCYDDDGKGYCERHAEKPP